MSSFVVGQRFLSEAEPELGLGQVERVENRRVFLRFPASDTTRQYAAQTAPIKRVLFRVGDEVENDAGLRFSVEDVVEEDGLIVYRGNGHRIEETELAATLRFSKPEERLLAGHWDESRSFDLRYRTFVRQYKAKKSPARGFLGARIELIPHQLYISHEIASRPIPRALLADEVGLGKTIEAGLVLHRLLRSEQITRVLILVPEPLVHQWFVEMFRRFHLSFALVNEPFCEALQASEPDENPFSQSQSAIVSLDWVADNPRRVEEVREAQWDMLVVDEAHHLEWAGTPSPQYALVEKLSRETRGLLLLTATPEQLGAENHFARLRLLDPDRYPSFESYQQDAAGYRHVAEVAGALLDGKTLTGEQGKDLTRFLPRSAKLLQARLKAVLAGDEAARAPFIEDLIDQHGPGRVVFRNARSVLDRVPERRARGRKLDWPDDRGELLEKLAREFVTDTRDTGVRLDYDYLEDPRAKWLRELLVELAPDKVLVLCRFKEKAIALQEALRVRSRLPVAVFHEDLSLLQRDRNAAWFADDDDDGAQALLCSEIGSEGRNFQFAHHLVLFDLPLNPELLEQRIGRLYRIGQEHRVEIHVPYLPGSPQEMLYLWYHEGLDAFEKSLPSGAYFDELAELLRELALEHVEECDPNNVSEPPEDMASFLERTRGFRDEVIAKLRVGRDRLLELGSFRPAAAEALVAEIRQSDEDKALDRYVQDALAQLGVELEEVSPRTFVFRKGNQLTVDDLPGLRGEEVGMTADRDKATHQGELDFLTWDHPMVTGVMELLVGSERGNSAVACFVVPGVESLLLEAVFVLDVVAPPVLYADRFLPPMPLRVVVDQGLRDRTGSLPPSKLKKKMVDARQVLRLTDRSWQDELLPKMIGAARELAEKERPRRIEASLIEMRDVMGKELRRLRALSEVNRHVRPEEVNRVEAETRDLRTAIESAKLRLDALRLIWKTPTLPGAPPGATR